MSESIRKVSTIFTIDDNEHNRKLKEINAQYKLTQSEIKLAGEKLNAFGNSTDSLKYKQDALSKQTATLRDKVNLYKESIEKASTRAEENNKKLQDLKKTKEQLQIQYKEAVKAYGAESEEAQKLKEQLNKVNEEYQEQKAVVDKNVNTVNNYKTKLNETESQLTKVEAELKKTGSELDKQNNKWITAGESLKQAGEKLKNTGEKMASVGGTLTKTVTLPILAAGTAALKTQIDWESAFAGVKKTVNGTEAQFKALEEGIRNMTKELPSSASEIAAVAEAAGQLGIQTDNVLGFTRTIIDLGNATNLVGDEGASQLAKFANITRMSQKDFDRLGSTIVDLGNNMATTEADIVAMAMRLAGAGHQVGMTEAQILSFAAALSSVGIEAEAGGSSFSKVMLNIQTEIQTGGKKVATFAKVAGMSTKEFAKAFNEDATGALIKFIEGLGKLDNKAVVLDQLELSEIRVRDALLRASGAGDLFNKSIQIGSNAWKENTALTNEASQRYATTESQIKILKNEVVDLARDVGKDLLPVAKDGLIVLKDVIARFKELSPETRENIIKFAALAAVTGPVIGGVGKVAQGLGGLMKMSGGATSALGATKLATDGLKVSSVLGSGSVSGLAATLGKVVIGAAPYVAAGAVIAGAGYAIYKQYKYQTNPEVKLFADQVEYTASTVTDSTSYMANEYETNVTKISEGTKTAVKAYLELDQKAKGHLDSLYINSTVITGEIKKDTESKINEMANTVIAGYERQKSDSIKELNEMFKYSTDITSQEQLSILQNTNDYYEQKKGLTTTYENQIKEILNTASQDNRALKDSEARQIIDIQNRMKNEAVQALSQNEVEARIILQRMKDYDGAITKETASEHIKKLNEQRDGAVKAANEEYDKRIAIIENMKAKGFFKSQEQADLMINEAKRQRDGIVQQAEYTRDEAVDKIFRMNNELSTNVDYTTGEVLGWWKRMFTTWDKWTPDKKLFGYTIQGNVTTGKNSAIGYNALGTNYFQGGLTHINERGYEIIEAPRGTKIKNHLNSEIIVQRTAEETAKAFMKNFSGQGVTVNNYSPKALSEAESARQFERTQKKIALGII